MNAHKMVTQWHSKVTPSGVKQDLIGQSLNAAYHYIHFGATLLQFAIFGPHKNHFTPNLVHQ